MELEPNGKLGQWIHTAIVLIVFGISLGFYKWQLGALAETTEHHTAAIIELRQDVASGKQSNAVTQQKLDDLALAVDHTNTMLEKYFYRK